MEAKMENQSSAHATLPPAPHTWTPLSMLTLPHFLLEHPVGTWDTV